jgi:hypothetical protein
MASSKIFTDKFELPSIKPKLATGERMIYYQQIDKSENTVTLFAVKVKNNSSLGKGYTLGTRKIDDTSFKINKDLDYTVFEKNSVPSILNKLNSDRATRSQLDNSFNENLKDEFLQPVKNTDPAIQKAFLLSNQSNQSNGTSATPAASATNPGDINKLFEYGVPYKVGFKPREDFGSYVYPLNVDHTKQDYIKFDIIKYNRRKISTVNKFTFDPRFDPKVIQTSIGSIILPIQSSISDSNTISWTDDKINIFEMALAGISAGIQEGIGIDKILDGIIEQTLDNNEKMVLEGMKTGMIAWMARKASNPGSDGDSFLSRMSGAIINPNLELLFAGPMVRNFNFVFRMTPRSKDEAKQVKGIIRTFKEASAVQRGVGDIFLKSPYVFSIKYMYGKDTSSPHPAINRIKICALQSMSVNYIPEGTYMTYTDSTLTAYEMNLQFTELEPVYADDYQNTLNNYNVKSTEIGF